MESGKKFIVMSPRENSHISNHNEVELVEKP